MPPVSFNVTLSSPPAGGVVGGSPGVGTIYPGTVPGPSVSSVSSVSGNEGTSLVHTVTLSAVTTAPANYSYSLGGGTSTAVSDYTVPPTFSAGVTLSGGTLTVPSGVSSFTVSVAAISDGASESSETYNLTIGGVTGVGTISDVPGASSYRDNIPKITTQPTVGTPITYIGARLAGNPAATATRIKVDGSTVASGTTSATYTPVSGDVVKNLTVEVDYAGPVNTVSFPEIVYSDEWMLPVPVNRDTSTYALTSNNQPGSRLYYIDPVSGLAPNAGDYYFFDGTNIIDSSGSTTGAGAVAYGTDPWNPSGPIKPWKHWESVGPLQNGGAIGARSGGGVVGADRYNGTSNRESKPDWWLFKRGTTVDFTASLADYKSVCTGLGTTNTAVTSCLGTCGGTTWAGRQVVGSYGSLATARPVIQSTEGDVNNELIPRYFSGVTTWQNVQYIGIKVDMSVRTTQDINPRNILFSYQGTISSKNVWFTDCVFKGSQLSPINQGANHIRMDRCAVIDSFTSPTFSGHCQGIYTKVLDRGSFQFVNGFMARNGFPGVNPADVENNWDSIADHSTANAYTYMDLVRRPDTRVYSANGVITSGTAFALGSTGATWRLAGADYKAVGDVFSRNNYWSGSSALARDASDPLNTVFANNITLRGGSGEQLRGCARAEANYVYQGYFTTAADGGAPNAFGVTGSLNDNVMMQYVDQNGGSLGHPGWGISVVMGIAYQHITRNLLSNAMYETDTKAFSIGASAWQDEYIYKYPVRNNTIEYNIFATTGTPFPVEDGYGSGALAAGITNYGSGPGVSNNTISNNWLATVTGTDYTYSQLTGGPASDLTSTTLSSNTKYATAAALATALGGVDSTRTHRTYLTSLGVSVAANSDGVPEWIDIWENDQRRGNWNPNYEAKALVNYIKAGWGLPALNS